MSGSNITEISKSSWNILTEHQGNEINEKFVFKITRKIFVNKEVKNSCKVLHFSSEWNFEEVLEIISKLNPKEYQQLFIFIIETTNFGFTAENKTNAVKNCIKLKTNLLKFSTTRPLILQLISEEENVTRLFSTEMNSTHFIVINQQDSDIAEINNFRSFLSSFLNEKFTNFKKEVSTILKNVPESSIILRFLRLLRLDFYYFYPIILNICNGGHVSELLAALDASFEENGINLSSEGQDYLKYNSKAYPSVLLAAVENENTELIDYMINNWTHFIQKLPFEDQVKVSTAAFETDQLDVLCDLLDIADYPFPKNFVQNDKLNIHERLSKIIKERAEFKAAIEEENYEKIDEFISKNKNIKIGYNLDNDSAMKPAADLENLRVYCHLAFFGFKASEFNSLEEHFDNDEKKLDKLRKFEEEQKLETARQALTDRHVSVRLLCNRSPIQNKKISAEDEEIYRKKIEEWFKAIYNIKYWDKDNNVEFGALFLDIASSCDNLKIIFNFESQTIGIPHFYEAQSVGEMDHINKLIFIGAQLSDEEGQITGDRDQTIKGTLAHELCHYVMHLIYANGLNPYFKHSENIKEKFEKIVKKIDKWSSLGLEYVDDHCNEIISSVFQGYESEWHHSELIVRVLEILATYDHDDLTSAILFKEYEDLFKFWQDYVIPEMQRYLLKNKSVINFNGYSGCLNKIIIQKYKLKENPERSKQIKSMTETKLTLVNTNVPKLLFIDIIKHLQRECGSFLDSQNLFIEPKIFENHKMCNEYKICSEGTKLNIFVDCTNNIPESLETIIINNDHNFIFVVSNEGEAEKLSLKIKHAIKSRISYNWNDLTEKSQSLLLETKMNFQNSSKISLMDLLKRNVNQEEPTTSKVVNKSEKKFFEDLSELINEQLLNLFLKNKQVSVNITEKTEKYFELIVQPREFFKKTYITSEDQEIKNRTQYSDSFSKDQLLYEVNNKQYVLISSQAGNGKSWAMKTISDTFRLDDSVKWVTYVDLKQFIDEFKAQNGEPEFSAFMVDRILKPKHNFELKIFKKLYKNGKVFILFDGFDEIAPNYADFVSKLAKNFKSNGGNQLWIATRDYFEVDLQEKLNIDVAYSLRDMTEDEGVDLIARSWILKDLEKDKITPKSKEEFDKCIKMSPKYESYQQKASQIIKKALISRNNSVGLPQLFKMIADGFKDEENLDDFQGFKIYDKFIDIVYIRWSREKGQIREEANVKSQRFELNFYKFHQYHAILSLFPELAAILFPKYNGSEWKDAEIIACGIMTIIDGKIYFLHETFREYFIADFVAKNLKESQIDETIVEIFVNILTIWKFGGIRMFLNDMIEDESLLQKILPQAQMFAVKFEKIPSFGEFFVQNHKNLVDFVLDILKILKRQIYNQVREILNVNAEYIAINTSDSHLYKKFQDFFITFLNVKDLKKLIIEQEISQVIIGSSLEIEIFEDFITNAEAQTNREFIRTGLMLMSKHRWKGNIFFCLSQSSNLNTHKVQKSFEIMEKFFTFNEIFKLVNKCNNDAENISELYGYKKENLNILFTEILKYFAVQKFSRSLKEIAKQCDKLNQNFLHNAACSIEPKIHESLWIFLLKIFADRDELKEFILQKDFSEKNFIHELVEINLNPEIIKLTFKILSENLSKAQFREILTSKGFREMNLLQYAAHESKVIEIQQCLWKLFRDSCGTDEEFPKLLKEVDGDGRNILKTAACRSSRMVFEFIIRELNKIASEDDIKEMLNNLNKWNQNLLQLALRRNKYSDIHQTLWKTIRKYFEKNSEILHLINNVDNDGNNLLLIASKNIEMDEIILELTWNEIKCFMTHEKQVEYLKMKDKNDKNLIECSLVYRTDQHKVHKWLKNLMKEYENQSKNNQTLSLIQEIIILQEDDI